MSGYRNEWACCGSETYTDSWEPEECPFCELDGAYSKISKLKVQLEECVEVMEAFNRAPGATRDEWEFECEVKQARELLGNVGNA